MNISLRERRRQLLHNEILQAARRLVIEKGYAAMSMDELATQVGISKPTLYSHFPTKEDLVVAAATQSMQRVVDIIALERPDQSPLQILTLLLRSTIQILIDEGMLDSRPMAPEMVHIMRSRPETMRYIQQIDSAIIDLVQQGIEQGEIDPSLTPEGVVLAYHGLIHTIKVEFFCQAKISDPVRVADTLTRIFERGIRTAHLGGAGAAEEQGQTTDG